MYGGFSQRCDDFCDDMWSFNVSLCERFRTLHTCQWHQIAVLGRNGPGGYVAPAPFSTHLPSFLSRASRL